MSRNPIQDHFVILCSKLNLEKILPYLKQERMVTTDEYEMLTSPNFTTRQKREKLLIWLPRKGRNYFNNFGKCLVWSGQTELARHIGVDVALVPDPPFQIHEEEPSPAEQQQQIFNMLRGIMNSGQPPPAYSSSTVPPQNFSPHPAQPFPLVNGGDSAPSKAHQPSTNTGGHIFVPGESGGRGPGNKQTPPPAEPMDLSGPVVPKHLRPDRDVLRASTANQEPPIIPLPPTKGKVFILYSSDGLPPEFSDEILDLADTLNHCGGYKCEIDHYVDVPPPNWNMWTIQQIQQSEYVILVYTPTLAATVNSGQNVILNMEKGKYYANGIINLMHPPKFIPVYLNGRRPRNNVGWLPPQLHTSTQYVLNIDHLREAIEVPDGSPEHVFTEKLSEALHEDRFRDVAKLVSHLRGTSDTSRPNPPQKQVDVPNYHPPEVVRLSHAVHPQSQMLMSAQFDNVPSQGPPQPAHYAHQENFQSGILREAHVAHPEEGSNEVYWPPPQVSAGSNEVYSPPPQVSAGSNEVYHPPPQVPPVNGSQSTVPQPSHCLSGLQREGHVAHPQSEVQRILNGTEMQHPGREPASIQSYNHDTGLGYSEQSMTSYEGREVRDYEMRKIGLVLKGNWIVLGQHLGLDGRQLEDIRKSLGARPDYDLAALKVLNTWKAAKKQEFTRELLKQALCRMNYGQLVKEMFPESDE